MDVFSDIRFALRSFRLRPIFWLTGLLTVAAGVGATTAVFGVVRGVLLRPLPYEDPDRAVRVLSFRAGDAGQRGTISYPNAMDLRAENRVFEHVSLYDEWTPVWTGNGPAIRLEGGSVDAAFFRVLGVRPARGRLFTADEDPPGSAASVIISHGFWQRRLGSDPEVIGRTLNLNDSPYTIVGVLPREFEDPSLSSGAYADPDEIWRSTPGYFNPESQSRSGRSLTAIARLRPDVTLESAQLDADRVMRRLVEAYPADNEARVLRLVRIHDQKVATAQRPLWVLLGASGLLLLLAAANVANLLLTRASDRRREFAMRAALGAKPARLIRQLLTESLVLACAGGVLGVLVAFGLTRVLLRLGGDSIPRADLVGVDPIVLGFAFAVMIATAALFGVGPALRAGRTDAQEALREARGTDNVGQIRLRSTLVAAEVAIAVLLLVGTGLLGRSFWNLTRVDPGFSTDGVLTMQLDVEGVTGLDAPTLRQRHRELDAQVEALAGVEAAGFANILPMSGSFNGMPLMIPGYQATPGERVGAEIRAVTPGFFAALGLDVAHGRALRVADGESAPRAVVVNRSLAERYWGTAEVAGRRIGLMDLDWEIVGVIEDVRQFGLDQAPLAALYVPVDQTPEEMDWLIDDGWLMVRARGEPSSYAAAVRDVVWSIDPDIPVHDVTSMHAVLSSTTAGPRFRAILLGTFSGLALLLGTIGIYGVLSYNVTRRRRELGIRAALGSSRSDLLRLVVSRGMYPVVGGILIGLVLAVLAGRVLSGLLFEISPTEPTTLVTVAVLLGCVSLVACLEPARRAARIDPMEALRLE